MAMDWTQSGTQVFACAVAQLLVSSVAVALRLISRGRILRILGPTDWFMVLTLVRVPGGRYHHRKC
jgi:branched-subunit amino acid transport protein AzlD